MPKPNPVTINMTPNFNIEFFRGARFRRGLVRVQAGTEDDAGSVFLTATDLREAAAQFTQAASELDVIQGEN